MANKRTPKPARGVQKLMQRDPNSLNSRKVSAAIEALDIIVVDFENRWGIDRLPTLVDEALRNRFYDQLDRLNAAIQADIGSEVKAEAEAMARGYAALERTAKANGHKELSGEFWEAAMPNGQVLAICRTFEEQDKVARENRDMVVYSVEEIANILAAWEGHKDVTLAKHLFPGAEVAEVRFTGDVVDDELPF